MELRHLRYFIAVVEEGAAGEAARRATYPAKASFVIGFLTGTVLQWFPRGVAHLARRTTQHRCRRHQPRGLSSPGKTGAGPGVQALDPGTAGLRPGRRAVAARGAATPRARLGMGRMRSGRRGLPLAAGRGTPSGASESGGNEMISGEFDVVVVGAGNAGMCAALAARARARGCWCWRRRRSTSAAATAATPRARCALSITASTTS